jgi:hypothetical protein
MRYLLIILLLTACTPATKPVIHDDNTIYWGKKKYKVENNKGIALTNQLKTNG